MDLPGVFDAVERVDVERQTEHVEHVAEHPVADGHDETASEVPDRRAPTEAVRRLQTDGAHAPVADLLRDLRGDLDLLAAELDGELQCVVDLGQRAPRELDVDDRAGNGDDFAVLQCGLGFGNGFGNGHVRFLALSDSSKRSSGDDPVEQQVFLAAGRVPQRLGATDDLHDLGGDGVLAGTVHGAAEGRDEVFRVVGGRLHGALASGVLGRRRVEERGEQPSLRVTGQQPFEDGVGVGLELVARGRGALCRLFEPARIERHQPADDDPLRSGGQELRVHDLDRVDLLVTERLATACAISRACS